MVPTKERGRKANPGVVIFCSEGRQSISLLDLTLITLKEVAFYYMNVPSMNAMLVAILSVRVVY